MYTKSPESDCFNGTKDHIKLEHICLFICMCRLSFMSVSFNISDVVIPTFQTLSILIHVKFDRIVEYLLNERHF